MARRLNRRVVAPDHRGHGRSDHVAPGGFYHFFDYVSDVDHVVRHLGGRVDLVGHSMGGSIACLYAATRPETVRRLVLIEGLGPEDASHRRVAQAQTFLAHRRTPPRHTRMASVDEAAERMRRSIPSLDLSRARELAGRVTRPLPDEEGLVWRWDALHRSRSPRTFETDVFITFLQAIEAPTLVLHGQHSTLHLADVARRVSAIANAEERTLDGGHNLHHDAPQRLADEIAEFLARENA